MMIHFSKKQPAPSRPTVRRATLLTAALGLLLACSGGGKEEELGRTTVDLSALPDNCRVDKTCGNLVGVDCHSEVDGPYYYVEERTGRVVETCGGACMGGPKPDQGLCVQCPPQEWTCD